MRNILLSRRGLLGASAAGLAAFSRRPRAFAASPPLRLTAGLRTLEVNGKSASVFGITGPDGTPGLVIAPGQRFAVTLANRAGEDTIVHWHGQTPPYLQDGVAETGGTLIANGADQGYDFVARPGTHWMHSHHGLQEQMLMAAPLIVRAAEDVRADTQEVTVLLEDFAFRDPVEILAELGGHRGHGAAMPGMTMTESGAAPMTMGTSDPGATMDLNDIEYDAYLANDRTLADPLVVRTERGGRVRLRLINGAATTAFWIDFGALDGTLIAVDGDAVRPLMVRRFPLAQGQRADVLLDLREAGAFPVLAQREGDRQRTGIILATPQAPIAKLAAEADSAAAAADLSLEARLSALQPLPPRRLDAVRRIALTGTMAPYVWSIDGRAWREHQPLVVSHGQRVELTMVNRSRMAHPMHLHGHHFQVTELGGKRIAGALRDTVLVPVNGSVTIAFDADNPGRWLFHCHNLFHMTTGMMTELVYDNAA
ncbi:multicopper oxidase family protein [Acidiphilium sp.]|uniref:multicopper oxidase family protein n=1 Tax=Acidiphilium sp. TaxID=527 RepID=UPI002589D89D|nr:multicopper oxidase family protein [Acidiphilium sp.]